MPDRVTAAQQCQIQNAFELKRVSDSREVHNQLLNFSGEAYDADTVRCLLISQSPYDVEREAGTPVLFRLNVSADPKTD